MLKRENRAATSTLEADRPSAQLASSASDARIVRPPRCYRSKRMRAVRRLCEANLEGELSEGAPHGLRLRSEWQVTLRALDLSAEAIGEHEVGDLVPCSRQNCASS